MSLGFNRVCLSIRSCFGRSQGLRTGAVYLAALVRDASFPPILAKFLQMEVVRDECEYACPVVFALTVHACFAGWKVPTGFDPRLTTVHDLRTSVQYVSHINLKIGILEDVVQGSGVDSIRKQIEGKTEEELIQMAGPATESQETRMTAAFRLQTLISTSKNRIDLYLLALNDFEDGSGEYKSAVYQSIYRAETAKARGL